MYMHLRNHLSWFKRYPSRTCIPASEKEVYQVQSSADGASEPLSELLTLQRSQLEGWMWLVRGYYTRRASFSFWQTHS
jgi:hypothetical protein